MLGKLQELEFRHGHQGIDFIFGAFEVFNAEGVDGDDLDTGFVTDFEDLMRFQASVNL